MNGLPLEFGIGVRGPKCLNDGATRWSKKFSDRLMLCVLISDWVYCVQWSLKKKKKKIEISLFNYSVACWVCFCLTESICMKISKCHPEKPLVIYYWHFFKSVGSTWCLILTDVVYYDVVVLYHCLRCHCHCLIKTDEKVRAKSVLSHTSVIDFVA